eukprot:TRINITY_DN10175_c0_g1_i3.p1 TRINITY_DN10175_c0_g1~~TRINITY_DN10175_c0_g1_i3.p1  ORF type:complete len:148 (-),score=37.24 TRINITY_DN10175_c0_g1_i3:146-589(-)
MMNQNPNGFFSNSIRYLDNLGFAVNSLCDMTRTIENNADGLTRLGSSLQGLLLRIKGFSISFVVNIAAFLLKVIHKFASIFSWASIKGIFRDKKRREQFLRALYQVMVLLGFVLLVFTWVVPKFKRSVKYEKSFEELLSKQFPSETA